MAPRRRSCRTAKKRPAERWQRSRASRKYDRRRDIKYILSRFQALCTASAVSAHDLAHLAAIAGLPATNTDPTTNSALVHLALHVERITCELHTIGQVLPPALMLACMADEAGEP